MELVRVNLLWDFDGSVTRRIGKYLLSLPNIESRRGRETENVEKLISEKNCRSGKTERGGLVFLVLIQLRRLRI